MIKLFTLVLIVSIGVCADEKEGGRQKRLLFFDEDGTLVKTYPNPYVNHLALNADLPYYGKFLNPFFSFIRAFGEQIAAFAIPVSKAILEQINKDPNFQISLVVVPKDPIVAPNSQCNGKRTQIPSPTVCNNFLNCWDGWAFEQECPKGLLFSNEGYCDYAGNVNCQNRKLDYTKFQPEPQCSKDFEAFRSKESCNEFYVCVNREPVKFKCPADLAYSQLLGVCDYADRVDCKSTASPIQLPAISLPSIQFPPIPQLPNPNPLPAIPMFPQTPISPEKPKPTDIPSVPSGNPNAPSGIPESTPIKPTTFPIIPSTIPQPANPVETISAASIPAASIPSASIPAPSLPAPSIPSQSPPSQSIPTPSIPLPSFPSIPSLEPQQQISSFPTSPELRPVPIFAPIENAPKPNDEKPALSLGQLFTPGCAGHVAMSREDAIRQLQSAPY